MLQGLLNGIYKVLGIGVVGFWVRGLGFGGLGVKRAGMRLMSAVGV